MVVVSLAVGGEPLVGGRDRGLGRADVGGQRGGAEPGENLPGRDVRAEADQTEDTCPETGKLTLASLTGSIVPVESRVWVTSAR